MPATESDSLVYKDDLTGLHNRRYFREQLKQAKRRADHDRSSFSLMMIDLDNFKPINDNYGHLAGDAVLVQVGKLLKSCLRSRDILCRYAGDEFVLILPGATESEVENIAQRISETFSQAAWHDENGNALPPVTCSSGYAFLKDTDIDLNVLINRADQALYAVKRKGGNGFCGDSDLANETNEKILFSSPELVGRTSELKQLKTALETINNAGGRFVLVNGEAGIGKTRLLKELQHNHQKQKGLVLEGCCYSETIMIPYYPVREALDRFFQERSDKIPGLMEALPEYSRIELTRILPNLKKDTHVEIDSTPDPYRLFESVRLFIQALAEQPSFSNNLPVLLIIEDLHFSDRATLDLLHYLARNIRNTKIFLCSTFRREEEESGSNKMLSGFLSSVRSRKLADEIALSPLSERAVSMWLQLICQGISVPQGFISFIYRQTNGNPFFIEELMRLLEKKDIADEIPRLKEIPQSIQALLKNRMNALDPSMVEILSCGALLGKDFKYDVLVKVLEKTSEEILSAVEAGVRNFIVRENFDDVEETYCFIHNLMAEVLYSRIALTRRRLWHGKAALIMEQLYGDRLEILNGRLSHNFAMGENWEKAVYYALWSARRARENYALKDALKLFNNARKYLPKLHRDTWEEAVTICEGLGDVYWITGDYENALNEYSSMETLAGEKQTEMKQGEAFSKIALVKKSLGNINEAMKYAEKSYLILQHTDNKKALAYCLKLIGSIHFDRQQYDEALECDEKSLALYKELGSKVGIAMSLNNIGAIHLEQNNTAKAYDCFQEALSIHRKIGNKWGMAISLDNLGEIHGKNNEYEKAANCLNEALMHTEEIGAASMHRKISEHLSRKL